MRNYVYLALVVVACGVFFQCWKEFTMQFKSIHIAENAIEQADVLWQRALASDETATLREALEQYSSFSLGGSIQSNETYVSGGGIFARVMIWLVRPLRLRALHRVAAARELLRGDAQPGQSDAKQLVLIGNAHRQLLKEKYCDEMVSEAMADLQIGKQIDRKNYQKCLAPIARGTIIFASGEAEAAAAFFDAKLLPGPFGEGTALTWTSRWQLPDHHVPGLKAQPWWMELPAVASLEAQFDALAIEFQQVLSSVGGEQMATAMLFQRRRADAWIAQPKEGWGMMPLTVPEKDKTSDKKRCVAPVACELVKQIRKAAQDANTDKFSTISSEQDDQGEADLAGVGYYMLQPGTRLQVHAGPTNTRLTCHLTLDGGDDSWFFVGAGDPRQWEVGKAFCFDDSFVHHAVHNGTKPRFILLMDIPHPHLSAA